jgi:hypothetical protein
MSFETEFFGPGNRLRWDAIQSGALSQDTQKRLGPFLNDLSNDVELLALPRVLDDGSVIWYIACRSSRMARIARDQVRAFLGPSYTDFDGRLADLNQADSVERAVSDRFGRNAFRVSVPDRRMIDLARERLQMLLQLRKEQPVFYTRAERPVGRILRDFEYGLLSSDEAALAHSLEELRATGRLSPTNLLFLEIRRFAAGYAWDAILTLPELDSLLSLPRPRGVTEAIIKAVYHSRLAALLEGNRPTEALEAFRSRVLDRFRDLYRTKANLSGFAVDASFAMVDLTAEPPHRESVVAMLASYEAASNERTLLRSLIDTTVEAPLTALPNLEAARTAFAEGDIDRCYALTVDLPSSFERSSLLLRVAREMSSLTAAEVAIEACLSLDPVDQDRIHQHALLSRALQSLTELVAEDEGSSEAQQLPRDWTSWMRLLTGSKPWAAAVVVAETGSREWSLEDLLQDGDSIQEVADQLIANRPDWALIALRDALPYFLKFCLAADNDVRLRPVFENLFLAIAVDSASSLPQTKALLQVIDYRLQVGAGESDYMDMLEQLASSLQAIDSSAVIQLALDALETVIIRTCPDTETRQNFCANVIGTVQRWRNRLDRPQHLLLLDLAHELELDAMVSSSETSENVAVLSPWERLGNKRLAIYSLQEAAMRRAVTVVETLCQSVRIQTFNDHVGGSSSLQAAARQADVFVVVTGAAKHAATIYIESLRPPSSVTLYAAGQGSSSILQAIQRFLDNG